LYVAVASFTAQFPDRLTFRRGDILTVHLQESGWAWASTEDGEQGWVPLSVLSEAGNEPEAGADFLARELALADLYREPVIRAAIDALQLPAGSCGLDAGCGIGSNTLLLAEAVGSEGKVFGLDSLGPLLTRAIERASDSPQTAAVSFREGDVRKLPFADGTFDWVWSADCVGMIQGDPVPLVRELARVTRPGGRVALAAWSSQRLLPGYPLLESRLNAAAAGLPAYLRHRKPEWHFQRAPDWFRQAGLVEVEGRDFAGEVRAPLTEELGRALLSLFRMLWGDPQAEQVPGLEPPDVAEYRRLCNSGTTDFILDLPGYFAFFTYTLFRGRIPG